MDHRGCRDRPRAGPWSRRCNCRLPAADWGRGPDIGFRAHLGRRLARGALDRVAALCASYLDGLFLSHHRGGCCAIPFLSIPAAAPNPAAPSPPVEALWQAAWFLLSLALYIEAGRTPKPA